MITTYYKGVSLGKLARYPAQYQHMVPLDEEVLGQMV